MSISILAVKFGNQVGRRWVITQEYIGSVRFEDSLRLYQKVNGYS